MSSLGEIRNAIREATLGDETALLSALVDQVAMSKTTRRAIASEGADLVTRVRANSDPSLMENFLAEFGLSTKEGVALMCLAEALLRIPDAQTVDALIADKISSSNWDAHLGKASSSLVNASTWALMLTGRVLNDEEDRGLLSALQNLVRRVGEPVIRTAVAQAMRELGRQFVLGETIGDALARGRAMQDKGYTYSFDMLGEAAINEEDAMRYHLAYADAITQIAKNAEGGIRENPGISVKLSALHARYELVQKPQMFDLLVSRTKSLAMLAKGAGIGFNIDAEEAARLDISLDVIQSVASDPAFEGWEGFGIVVQAYSKRADATLDWLYTLAKTHQRKIMVRLVKGAYWDTEIKQAQVLGLTGFPVFTRKQNTDISYIACAKKLLSMCDYIYPQFATHNAHSVAAILHMAGDNHQTYEFQRLHGMGEALLNEVMKSGESRCRIYAPVGAHKDLLAYLVRRLLENGANSSFVHQMVDETVAPEEIATDPFAAISQPSHNPNIALPEAIFGSGRKNSTGFDINDPIELIRIDEGRMPFSDHQWQAKPLLAVKLTYAKPQSTYNPVHLGEQVGTVENTSHNDIEDAILAAKAAQVGWSKKPASSRAALLNRAADLYEDNRYELYALLTREAGKTIADCIGELREAVDFLRYYANEAIRVEGMGISRGVFACISPWNFPLAIFTGQIAAALGAGNAVMAKPAEQTPLIAYRATQILLQAGIPKEILQLLTGDGPTIGGALTTASTIDGVCFTGSTDTARIINQNMAQHLAPDAPLIAETGGLNVMIVDSSALPQQAIKDVLASAFQSAGQRCSACRLLYLQSDIAGEFVSMLEGAMASLKVGDPWQFDTDIGPLIDQAAFREISSYAACPQSDGGDNLLLPPLIKKIGGIDEMEREIFGPVLHIATYETEDLDKIIDQINGKGYGLTFGLHTRIDARVDQVTKRIECGNVYINRNQIGAIVGSQPFGGEGLSGTGPKAGGPNYLQRFMRKTADAPNLTMADEGSGNIIPLAQLQELIDDLSRCKMPGGVELKAIIGSVAPFAGFDAINSKLEMPGPTGESNVLRYAPKGTILCLGPSTRQARKQAIAALGAGCRAVVVCDNPGKELLALQQSTAPIRCYAGRLNTGDLTRLNGLGALAMYCCNKMADIRLALARRKGAILSIVTDPDLPTAFLHERHTCIDTTAAGGNAALMVEAG